MTGAVPDELAELRSHVLPPGTDYLWEWFMRLNSTRPVGFGTSAISETELQAFFNNRKITPTPWEIDMLVRMDRTMREAASDDAPRPDDEEVEG
jgi:hypothetical protein